MWRTVKLGALYKVGSSKRVLKADWKTEGVPFYRGREITSLSACGYVDNDLFISEQHYESLSQKSGVPTAGDIMITAIGTIGNTYIVKSNHKFYFKDASVLWLKKEADVSSKYIQYWLKTDEFYSQLDKGNGATVDTLTIKKLASVVLPLPPLAEQQRIVAKLDAAFAEIDRAVEVTTSKLENNNQLAECALISILETIEKGNGTTLGAYYDVRDGTHDSPKYVNEGYPLVTSKNLKTGTLDLSNVKYISEEDYVAINKRSAVHVGDVLMAMIGTIGNPIVITHEPNYSIKNVALFKTNTNQNPWFLKYFLEHPSTQRQMQQDAKGTTQKFVGLGYLRNFPICAPSLQIQNRIVGRLDAVFDEIATINEKLSAALTEYEALKSAILTRELQPPQSAAA
jgi:type I restriction enzyme S subunit